MICFQKCYYAGGRVSVPRIIEDLDAMRAHHEPRLAVHGESLWQSLAVRFRPSCWDRGAGATSR
eukprot:825332-Pleurochrysis_carterae.AAC.1